MRLTVAVFAILLISICTTQCIQKEKADLLVYNATIYTVDSSFSTAEAMVVSDGKIVAIGKSSDLRNKYETAETIDAQQKFIYPGFIDAHAHFLSYGLGLQEAKLVGTNSWAEIVMHFEIFPRSEKMDGSLDGAGIRTTGLQKNFQPKKN